MKRIAAHFIFCSPGLILRHHAIELNDESVIVNIFDLKALPFETANTLFYNGIITSEILSAKQFLNESEIEKLINDRHYIDFSGHNAVSGIDPEYTGIFDFGTNNTDKINRLIRANYSLFADLKFDQFINASCFQPQQLLKPSSVIRIGNKVRLLNWEGINLTTMQIGPEIRISRI